jgi:hypothetical protein
MGKYNSSHSRVVPVFDALMDEDTSGRAWLHSLLRLGSCFTNQVPSDSVGTLSRDHPRWWGKNERRLDPPLTLLQWLVANLSAPKSDDLWGSAATREKRERLVERDPATIAEALRLLRGPRATHVWYVLEGQSQPDACLQTETLLVVIEGKRTERTATSMTTWMPRRSQMLRHMDAASEIRGDRRVVGLMIVEGQSGAYAMVPSEYWLKEAKDQVLERTLADSLPHRSADERIQIADGFVGVVTWQRVCAEFALPWPPCHDND